MLDCHKITWIDVLMCALLLAAFFWPNNAGAQEKACWWNIDGTSECTEGVQQFNLYVPTVSNGEQPEPENKSCFYNPDTGEFVCDTPVTPLELTWLPLMVSE